MNLLEKASPKGKKGVSLMISYVLLIGMVVTLGVIVASWLYIQAKNPPIGEEEDCEGVSISAAEILCSKGSVQATLTNTGRFTIDKIYVKVDTQESEVMRYDLDPNDVSLSPGEKVSDTWSSSTLPSDIGPITHVKFIPYIGILCPEQITYKCS